MAATFTWSLACVISLGTNGRVAEISTHEDRLQLSQDELYRVDLICDRLYIARNGQAKFFPALRALGSPTRLQLSVFAFTTIHIRGYREPFVVVTKRSIKSPTIPGKWCLPGELIDDETLPLSLRACRALEDKTGDWFPRLSFGGVIAISDNVSSKCHHGISVVYHLRTSLMYETAEGLRAKMAPQTDDVDDILLLTLDDIKGSTDESANLLKLFVETMCVSKSGYVSWD